MCGFDLVHLSMKCLPYNFWINKHNYFNFNNKQMPKAGAKEQVINMFCFLFICLFIEKATWKSAPYASAEKLSPKEIVL